ncbi:MAG TPA: hypothetical protein VKR06_05555, partial [Ktedonosporobacter sp.]|nr:hypothetical protein [Ktedonosporobacter sp.]
MPYSFSRRRLLKTGVILAGGATVASSTFFQGSQFLTAHMAAAATPLPWPAANDILATTTVPSFPSTTFPVTTYGAKGDGHTDNTAAFAK